MQLLVADFWNLANIVVLVDTDVVVPVDFSGVCVDVDDKARLEFGGRSWLGVVTPASERVTSNWRPWRPVLSVPHPLTGHHAIHPRRPERLTACHPHATAS